MSYYESQEPVSMLAKGTIGQYEIVMVDVANNRGVLLCTDIDNTGIIGIVQENCAAGDCVNVAIGGVSKGKASATIARGAQVASTTAGLLVTAASGMRVVGIALHSGSVNDVIPVLLSVGQEL